MMVSGRLIISLKVMMKKIRVSVAKDWEQLLVDYCSGFILL